MKELKVEDIKETEEVSEEIPKNMTERSKVREFKGKYQQDIAAMNIQDPIYASASEEKDGRSVAQRRTYEMKVAGEEYRKQQKEEQRRKIQQKRKIIKGFIIGTLTTLGLGGAIFIGKNVHDYLKTVERQKKAYTLEKAVQSGKTLQDLMLTPEIAERINELTEKTDQELSNLGLIELAQETVNLQRDTLAQKLAIILNIEPEDIEFLEGKPEPDLQSTKVIDTKNNKSYTRDSFLPFEEDTISSELADYIDDLANMYGIVHEANSKDFNREKILEACKKSLEKTNEMAAGVMVKDEKGNIDIQKVSIKIPTSIDEKGEVAEYAPLEELKQDHTKMAESDGWEH